MAARKCTHAHWRQCVRAEYQIICWWCNFFERDSEFELTDKVNKHLDKISLWCTANILSLSPDKTCYSIFGNYSHTGNIKLFLDGHELVKTERVKYIGLLIDEKPKWTDHIEHVYNKIIKYIGIFCKIRNNLPFDILKQLFLPLLIPKLIMQLNCTWTHVILILIKCGNWIIRFWEYCKINTCIFL